MMHVYARKCLCLTFMYDLMVLVQTDYVLTLVHINNQSTSIHIHFPTKPLKFNNQCHYSSPS